MEDAKINIQIPIEQLKEYIKSIFEEELADSMDDIADNVQSKIEDSLTNSITDLVTDSVQEDLRNNFSDYFDIDDYMSDIQNGLDYSDIASEVQERIDFGSEIESLAGQFRPGHHCGVGKAVEEVIYDGIEYGLTHDEDLAKAIGSFIDNWLYQPNPDPEVQKTLVNDAISRILGREDASNIHNDLMPQSTEENKEVPASERLLTIKAGDLHHIINTSIAHAFESGNEVSIAGIKMKIIDDLTTQGLIERISNTN
jgi:hypothetical protein